MTSDHGELFGEHGLVTHGRSLFDAEARVPLLVHWPGVVEPGDSDDPASHLDILPTLAERLGAPPHPSFQGTSLLRRPAASAPPRAVYLTIQGWRYADAVVCWPWKLIVERTNGLSYLFHLARDPREMDNRVETHPASRVDELLPNRWAPPPAWGCSTGNQGGLSRTDTARRRLRRSCGATSRTCPSH